MFRAFAQVYYVRCTYTLMFLIVSHGNRMLFAFSSLSFYGVRHLMRREKRAAEKVALSRLSTKFHRIISASSVRIMTRSVCALAIIRVDGPTYRAFMVFRPCL